MPGRNYNKRKEMEVTARRVRVCEMVRNGMTQREIAKVIGCGARTVGGDLKAVLEEWKDEARQSVATHQAIELARLNKIIQRATRSYKRSLKAEVVIQKTKATRDGKEEEKTVATRKEQCGDPRFLAEIRGAVALRAKLLGLDEQGADTTNVVVLNINDLMGRDESPSNVVDGSVIESMVLKRLNGSNGSPGGNGSG